MVSNFHKNDLVFGAFKTSTSETYSEPRQIYNVESLTEIVNS